MNTKWIGAILVIGGCGWTGFSAAVAYRREERCMEGLLRIVRYMKWELQYHLTPLPELCRQAGKEVGGVLGEILNRMAGLLDAGTFPEPRSCMRRAIRDSREIPPQCRELLLRLGSELGRFDLAGQLESLTALEETCREARQALAQGRGERLRSYRTLGLCAGAALAILFA